MATVWKESHIVRENEDGSVRARSSAAKVIYLISGIINGLLAIRFVLVLFGANTNNAFASLIYDLTSPLLAPFFGLFNYQAVYGQIRFEFETLVAIAVYSLVAWVLVRIFSPPTETTL